MSVFLDKIIDLLKWPTAISLFCSLPAFIESLDAFSFASWRYVVMMVGFFMFFVGRGLMDSSSRTSMEVLAHELTHAFFAIVTFHKVSGLQINQDDTGGKMAFSGKGNWLIIIAPYFFPLYCFGTMLFIEAYTMVAPMSLLLNLVLGFFLAFHFAMVGSQIHEKQTDLPKVGYLFCGVFLLPANLWMIGSILAFNSKGWSGVMVYQDLIYSINLRNFEYLCGLVGF